MTPTEERQFIALWNQEARYREIAQALGCALGTVAYRAATLMAQGKIQPRPRGGAYPRSKALARQDDTPHPRGTREPPARPARKAPAPPPADSPLSTREAPAITMVAVPELRELISRFSGLEAWVAALEDGTRGPTRGSTSSSGPCASPRR
jgi:DNA-binding transcriptional MocR family regulator